MPRLVWPFQLRSKRSSPRDLNLGGQNRSRGEQFSLSWQPQRAFVVSLRCMICIESSPQQFNALLARLHQQSTLIFATIALGHPKSTLESFQRLRGFSRCVFLSDSFSLTYWNLHWTVLKLYILLQHHNRLISGIQRTELFPLLSVQREGLRWSRLFDHIPHLVSILAILRIWLFTRSIRLSQTPITISDGGTI